MSGQTLVLGIRVSVDDADKATVALKALKQAAEGVAKPAAEVGKATTAAAAGVQGLAGAVGDLGTKTGKSKTTIDPTTASVKGLGEASKLSAHQAAQLSFQLQDFFIQVQSGQSPLTALLQQGSQLAGTFGSVRGAIAAVATVFTPARIAAGLLTGAVLTLATAAYKGDRESKELARTLGITGNAAGLTEDRFNSLAATLSRNTNSSIGTAREALQAMAASGRLSGQALLSATDAALRYSAATGASTTDAARDFAALTDGVAAGAAKLNQQFNFLSAEQLKYIRQLEAQGDVQKAVEVTTEALSRRIGDQTQYLTSIERAWKAVTNAASSAWDAIKEPFRANTPGRQLAAVQTQIASWAPQEEMAVGRTKAMMSERLAALRQQEALLKGQLSAQEAIADAAAKTAEQEKARLKWTEDVSGAMTAQEALARKIADANARATAAGVTDPNERAKVLRKLTQESLVYQQALDASLASIEARSIIAAERMRGELNSLNAQYAQGAISQVEYIERVADAEVRALEADRARLGEQLTIAKARENNAAQVIQLQAQLGAATIAIENRRKQAIDEVTTAVVRQHRAVLALMHTLREEGEGEIAAQLAEMERQRRAGLDAVTAYVEGVRDAIEQHEHEVSVLGKSEKARRLANEQFRIEVQMRRQLKALEDNRALTADDRITQEKRIREAAARETAAVINKVERESAASLEKTQAEAWGRITLDIRDSLTDAILSGGKTAGADLERYFANLVLRPVLDAAFNPVANYIGGLLGGGGAGAAGGAGGMGQLQQLGQTVQQINTLYNWGTKAAGWLGFGGGGVAAATSSSAALAAADGGMALTATAAEAGGAAAGAGASAAASWVPIVGWIIAAITTGSGLYKAGWNDKNLDSKFLDNSPTGLRADLFKGLGMSDKWANVLSSASGMGKLFGRKAPEVTSSGLTGSITGGDFSGTNYADIRQKGGLFRSDKNWTESTALDEDVSRFLDTAAEAVLASAKKYGEALSLPADSLASISTDIRVELTDDAEKNKQAIIEAFAKYGEALVESFADDVSGLKVYGESTSQTIERVAGALIRVNDLFKTVGLTLLDATVQGGEAALDLASKFGGLDQLEQAVGSFFGNFYSEAERNAKASELLNDALAEFGITVPQTRAQFRSLVEAQDRTTESGRTAFAALLGVSDAFAQLHPEVDAAAAAAEAAAEAERQAQEAARRAQEVARERQGLETRLLQMQGDTAALRTRELATLDPSNRAIQERIYALEDEASAAAAAARVIETANQAAARTINEVAQAASRLESAKGNVTAALQGVADFGQGMREVPHLAAVARMLRNNGMRADFDELLRQGVQQPIVMVALKYRLTQRYVRRILNESADTAPRCLPGFERDPIDGLLHELRGTPPTALGQCCHCRGREQQQRWIGYRTMLLEHAAQPEVVVEAPQAEAEVRDLATTPIEPEVAHEVVSPEPDLDAAVAEFAGLTTAAHVPAEVAAAVAGVTLAIYRRFANANILPQPTPLGVNVGSLRRALDRAVVPGSRLRPSVLVEATAGR